MIKPYPLQNSAKHYKTSKHAQHVVIKLEIIVNPSTKMSMKTEVLRGLHIFGHGELADLKIGSQLVPPQSVETSHQ